MHQLELSGIAGQFHQKLARQVRSHRPPRRHSQYVPRGTITMSAALTCQYDTSELTRRVSMLSGMLLGNGATEGEMQKLLKRETGQLHARMGDAAGPTTQKKGMDKLDKEIKSHLTVLSTETPQFEASKKYDDFFWLYASPGALVGIAGHDYQMDASGEASLAMLRASQREVPRGPAWKTIGQRGVQKIVQLDRVKISTSAMAYVRNALKDRVGQLRASFYVVAKEYAPLKRIPAWIAHSFGTVEGEGKSQHHEDGMGTPVASIESRVTSPGVISNGGLTRKFQGAITKSRFVLQSKLEKIGRGAKYLFESGQVYFPQPETLEDEE